MREEKLDKAVRDLVNELGTNTIPMDEIQVNLRRQGFTGSEIHGYIQTARKRWHVEFLEYQPKRED